jgi:hypothetical protein
LIFSLENILSAIKFPFPAVFLTVFPTFLTVLIMDMDIDNDITGGLDCKFSITPSQKAKTTRATIKKYTDQFTETNLSNFNEFQ